MESNLVDNFMRETSCDIETAYICLLSENWNFQNALDIWRQSNLGETVNSKTGAKLNRGISRASDNVAIVNYARDEIAGGQRKPYGTSFNSVMLEYSFSLPDFTLYGEEFQRYLEKDLIEASMLSSLEQGNFLNWWCENGLGERLWPIATTGDGNCLLHAASLGIWGFHDRLLTLRRALYDLLSDDESAVTRAIYRRWRWQQTRLNAQSGFVYSESEWDREWAGIVQMATVEPRSTGLYESLEEVHILALAHILRRPLVVFADVMLRDSNDEPLAPVAFRGIYLPIEHDPSGCHRNPLFVAYDRAHFSALVPMAHECDQGADPSFLVPLTDAEGTLLPVNFAVDPGPDFVWLERPDQSIINCLLLTEREQLQLLRRYMDVLDATIELLGPECDLEEGLGELTLETASKQLQSVAKQFGSIGKSVGRKIKRNWENLTNLGMSKSSSKPISLQNVWVEVRPKKHELQDEMINNYLMFAQGQYLKEKQPPKVSEPLPPNAQFGAGKSKFYTSPDWESYKAVKNLPGVKHPPVKDNTLYLSKSTFFNDSGSSFNDNNAVDLNGVDI